MALCLAILIGMIPAWAFAAEIEAVPWTSGEIAVQSAAEDNRLKSYDQFLAYYYQTFSLLDYLMEEDETPCKTIIKNADEDLEDALDA